MTDSGKAVFLSYASQDAPDAQHLCEALRAAGVEVWFDQSELRGGDAWDSSIRKQIKTCALFIPLISRHTHDRDEGYFRLEWKLAVDRSHLMSAGRAFLLPVVIDDTRDDDEQVPERFREVQWTRLPGGDTSPAFVERVRRLLSAELSPGSTEFKPEAIRGAAAPAARKSVSRFWRSRATLLAATALVVIALGYLAVNRLVPSKHSGEVAAAAASQVAPANAFAPPPHSIAVLPFVNLSGDKDQEYFSDGLTEELLNALAEIEGLQVAARTSAFSFKAQDNDIRTIARKLNVGAVLEGSVRRSAHTIRITAQLINSVTGFHQWSKTYDRDLGDVLKLQAEIATAVASALRVTLLGDVAAKVELGGTRNPAAFDAYLRGAKAFSLRHDANDLPIAIAAYTEAIHLDPHYALAFAARSTSFLGVASEGGEAEAENFERARADARQAVALAPDLAQAHLALGGVSEATLNFTQASESYGRALALAPGNAQVLRASGAFSTAMGQFDRALESTRRAVVLNPLDRPSHASFARTLYAARRYEEALPAFEQVISLAPDFKESYGDRGFAYYAIGDLQKARASCETKPDAWQSRQCLAVIYDKLGRHEDAEAELAKLRSWGGDGAAYQYATIYAQWGNRLKSLEWLETALRLRDPGLLDLKTDPLLDPLRKEPRFQAILRGLKFPP
jgi:TolB-like protein/tetratricopeptide (TPR) repeat protein